MHSANFSNLEHTPHRFLVMDGMRGVAALAVVCIHTSLLLGKNLFPRAYLAVDFFFLLSGFVISHAYGRKLDAGWSSVSFFKARLIRLYPLYALGLILGIALKAVQMLRYGGHVSVRTLLIQIVFATTMLPLISHKDAYPLNMPAWSLFGEVVANIFHAFFLRRRSSKSLALWAAVSGLVLLASILVCGSLDFGASGFRCILLVPRVLFSYIVGVLLERWWENTDRRNFIPAAIPVLCLLVLMALPLNFGRAYLTDSLAVLLLLPLLIAISARSSAGRFLPGASSLARTSLISVVHSALPDIRLLSSRDRKEPQCSTASTRCFFLGLLPDYRSRVVSARGICL
jgi:peptidoglycan/LPS O-acetylase OafA/YrhL